MRLGTLAQVARRLRATRAVIRGAVDLGLLQPARVRPAGDNRYVRLFNLAEADQLRPSIEAAYRSGELVPRAPRTHRHQVPRATDAAPVSDLGTRARSDYLGCMPPGCSPVSGDLMERLHEEAKREERARGRSGRDESW
ncbi:MAG: hypothetical protein HY905_07245 [Deltaproteobacteria bacterium]|nr:hypothetical protein [Deltaproteobacteria bacterium]